jgi:hypothetical protein
MTKYDPFDPILVTPAAPRPITQTTADAMWADQMPHSGEYSPPGDHREGTLEFDGVMFTVIRDKDIPPERRKRLRARLPIVRRRWWR